jgi:hypothetical protein
MLASFPHGPRPVRLRPMNRMLLISLVVFGVLVLALGGWTVRGFRRAGRFVRQPLAADGRTPAPAL